MHPTVFAIYTYIHTLYMIQKHYTLHNPITYVHNSVESLTEESSKDGEERCDASMIHCPSHLFKIKTSFFYTKYLLLNLGCEFRINK